MRETHNHMGPGNLHLRAERFIMVLDAFVRPGYNAETFSYQGVLVLKGICARGRIGSANS